MHELSIATEVIAIAEQEGSKRNLHNISEIGIRLGAFSGVDPEALSFCFEAATMDTSLANTKLNIEWIPVKAECLSCKKDFEPEDYIFDCPYCKSNETEIVEGDDLRLQYLIGEWRS